MPPDPKAKHVRDLDDGSWLATLQKRTDRKSEPMLVRAVDYTVDDGRGNDTSYRLFTTLLDPAEAAAVDLAAAYNQRWEIKLILDELKTHQRGPRTVLRSKSPRPGAAGNLGAPVLPLRDPRPDDRRRPPQRARSSGADPAGTSRDPAV